MINILNRKLQNLFKGVNKDTTQEVILYKMEKLKNNVQKYFMKTVNGKLNACKKIKKNMIFATG